MWIIQKNAVSDEQQDSIQKLENRFRSGEIGYLISIPKSQGFSQSLWWAVGGDTKPENQISPKLRFIERGPNINFLK